MWGKIVGTVLGLLLARLPGAILGFLIGHWFDHAYRQQVNEGGGFASLFKDQRLNSKQATFFYAMFATLGHLAKSKGRVTEVDIAQAQQLMRELELHGDMMREAQEAFREGKQANFPLEKTLKQFRQDSRGRFDLLQLFMEQLVVAALNDRRLQRSEYDVLLRAARALGFNKFQLDKWLLMTGASARFAQSSGSQQRTHHRQQSRSGGEQYRRQQQAGSLEDAYQALGVEASVSDEQVKKTYRSLMRQYHPDKLAAQGVPDQMMKKATQRSQEIQAAYEKIKRARRAA
ncbi:co-chaperone DjlA [Aliidiomarina sedimenti]|uniref:Co-chaperone protein DjlA n=1 Tax=Aliidiomarina sedimenti TaxID=1933879 RepID=A0ABY0BUJ1_9GAMM|nr:co-chaperone DjlA [Aliidiomarina sedimenti]RUO27906.1 co-chaperone DjlA [Aliidiomarina sedimenti]